MRGTAKGRWEAWRIALAVTLGAIGLRALLRVAIGTSVPIPDDQRDYLAIAREIALGHRFQLFSPGPPTAFRDPALPAFLAILVGGGRPLGLLWLAQILLSSATGALLVLAASREGRVAAWWTGVLFLLSADFAIYGFLAYTETLACFGLALLTFGLCRGMERPSRGYVPAGLGAALAVLTRAACGAPVFALLASFAWASAGARRVVVVALVTVVFGLGAWSVRNLTVVGVFAPNTSAAVNVYLGNNPRAPLVHGYRAMLDSRVWGPLHGIPEAGIGRRSMQLVREYAIRQPARAALGVLAKVPDALELDRILIGVGRRGQFPARSPRVLVLLGLLLAAASVAPRILGLACVLSPGASPLARAGQWGFLGMLLAQLVSIAHPRLMLPGWIVLLPGSALLLLRLRQGERRAWVALVASGVILVPIWVRQALLG